MIKSVLASAVALMLLSGCASKTGNEALEKANSQSIESILIKGTTTKAEVTDYFGEPQEVDFMDNGQEKWKYSHVRKSLKAINYVPVANWFIGGTNDTTKSLVLLFYKDVLVNYSIASAKGESKAGLFQ
mgnify:CR=1 FL=1